jgi:C1A family cysteine protease
MPVNSLPKIDLNNISATMKTRTVKKVLALQEEIKVATATWHAKETPHSFLTSIQKKALLGVVLDKEFTQEVKSVAASGPLGILPSYDPEVDWQTKDGGKVSPMKDQGTCGSCVSFGTVGLMESMALLEHDILLDLSEADLHFCSSHGVSCKGWYPSQALKSVKERGVTDEIHFPYASAFSGGAPICKLAPDRDQHVYKFSTSGWQIFDAYRKDYITHTGPMIACMTVYDDFFSYGSGVYHHVSGSRAGRHCILVIGYSESQGCWICKNSWGIDWGEAGFFKIAYGECGINNILSPFFGVQGIVLP